MFKWHVHSAIGRGRPAGHDFQKVADGIAASLRQFSISARRAEDEPPRRARSADVFKEVSALAPAPAKGIDARALAAKPPPRFRISRVDSDVSDPRPRPQGDRGGIGGGYRGGMGMRGGIGTRGGMGVGMRGAMRGGIRGGIRGRGGARGGARGRGRGRGGKSKPRGKRVRQPQARNEDYVLEPMTEQEIAYQEGSESGWLTPYIPTISKESLDRYGASTIASPRGLQENLIYKLQVATDMRDPSYVIADKHLAGVNHGVGTFFESKEQKELVEKYRFKAKFPELPPKVKTEIVQQWVGGKYEPPVLEQDGNIMARVAALTGRNETYLPEDRRKLAEKLASLLPAQLLSKQPAGKKATRKAL